jgi:glucose/arabinose dehydrogenase
MIALQPAAAAAVAGVLTLTGCASGPVLPPSAGFGPAPALPAPQHSLLPTIRIAHPEGWAAGQTPTPAAGLAVNALAGGLEHPRWLYVLPNGDVLVAETNAQPPPPGVHRSLVDRVMGFFQAQAGAGVPSPNRITLLRDADGDGVAETRTVFLQGLHSPFGMVLVGQDLYVADADAVLRFAYTAGATHIDTPGVQLTALPAGLNHHWTKNIVASADGSHLYVSVGSNSNVGENGLGIETERAAIWEVDRATGAHRILASGLRNPVGMSWNPQSGALWVAVNERDELGNDLVPDYMTQVRRGAFYGWPYSYYGGHVDTRVHPQRPDLVARATVPDFALGAHTASLGLTFYAGNQLGPQYGGGAFVGQHGSWNRAEPNGYKVIFVPFAGGRPAGPPQDVLTGFLDGQGHAHGRPVGVTEDRRGALLVADDVGNTIWRVTAAPRVAAR